MNRCHTLAWFAFSVAAAALMTSAVAQQQMLGLSDDDITKTVRFAAPRAIVDHATIVSMSDEGSLRVIRQGSNNFTCMAEDPLRGPGPMCADQNGLKWMQALIARQIPPADAVGLIYMLAGSTDASITDPFAQRPAPTENWVMTGPHVLILGERKLMDGYPRGPKPDVSQPYVMWAGTPYEHLMIPMPIIDYRALSAQVLPRN
jgi:hypothetical protein